MDWCILEIYKLKIANTVWEVASKDVVASQQSTSLSKSSIGFEMCKPQYEL